MAGGCARNLRLNIEWEIGQGHRVEVAVGERSDLADFPAEATVHRIRHLVREVRPTHDALAFWELYRLIRGRHYDIVNTHQSKAGILGRLAVRKHAAVVVHTIHMASFGPGYGRAISFVFRQLERHSARFTDLFVAVGEEVASLYSDAGIGRRDQYWIVRSPIGVDDFLRMRELNDADRRALRVTLGLPLREPLIVAAGLLEPRKRFGLLIARLAPILRRGDAMLVIAGTGQDEMPLRAQIAALGLTDRVRLVGYTRRMPDLLAVASVFVHAATAEGVSQVILQALAAGVQVVATEVEGLAELPEAHVRVAGRDGAALESLTSAALQTAGIPTPSRAFAPWNDASIETQLARLHQCAEAILSVPSSRSAAAARTSL